MTDVAVIEWIQSKYKNLMVILTNVRVAVGRRLKRCHWDVVELSQLPRQRVFPTEPYAMGSVNCERATLRRRGGNDESEGAFSLQANRKTIEGKQHPDRDAQFRHISSRIRSQQRTGQPALSVDTKKKEIIGKYKNPGRKWRPKGRPVEVQTHDFPEKDEAGNTIKAVPYGVYDIARNEAWVNVGITHDTAEFAVASLRTWWRRLGRRRYPQTKLRRVLITADSGGSNGSRNRLWKYELQTLADELAVEIEVCHFPPGTSKWNKIEHRVFCHITRTWRGEPLESYEVVVSLIGATHTTTGLEVHATLDESDYKKGIKISDADFHAINITPCKFHGDWNYIIKPRTSSEKR